MGGQVTTRYVKGATLEIPRGTRRYKLNKE